MPESVSRETELRATVRLVGAEGPGLTVRQIASWSRGELTMVMSASSGPKDYVRNQICALFDANPEITRVVMVRASGPPFVITQTQGGSWFDVKGNRITVGGNYAPDCSQ